MSWFNKPGRLISRSVGYDLDFLQLPHLRLSAKIDFVVKKYFSLITHPTSVSIMGKKCFYNERAGVAFLQSVFADNAFLINYCPSAKIVIDIGAHTGQFNFFCKHYLKAENVYSFEPIKQSFKTLSLNTQGKNIFPWAIALSPSVNLLIPNNNSYMASVFKLAPVFTLEKAEGKKLDEIRQINRLSRIDLLKIDTEGSELEVLKTCQKTLKKAKYVLVECSLNRPNSGDLTAISEFLYHTNKFKIIDIGRKYLTK